jgi:hypothetical protein
LLFLNVLAHHSEPGDPILLDWMRHQIDALVGIGPAGIVFGLGVVILLVPALILTVFLFDRARRQRRA